MMAHVLPNSRDGLNSRGLGSQDPSQVSIQIPQSFDLDNEIEGLRGQLGQLKQVCSTDMESDHTMSSYVLPTCKPWMVTVV